MTETIYRTELFGCGLTPCLIKGFKLFSFSVYFSTLIFKETKKRETSIRTRSTSILLELLHFCSNIELHKYLSHISRAGERD